MSELERTDISTIQGRAASSSDLAENPITVRVSPHSYLSAILAGTFFSGLAFYAEYDLLGYVLFAAAWVATPFFALRDLISFDGRSIVRTGLIPRWWSWLTSSRRRLKVSDIELVESQAIRALKRGGNIYYRYRTVLRGKGTTIVIASGGESYRRMIRSILPQVSEHSLDIRSAELRSYLNDPKETLMKAEFARLPSAYLLTPSFRKTTRTPESSRPVTESDAEADDLHELGNELRVEGHLAQALEAFRRAIRLRPRSGKLLFDAARCLYAFGTVEREPEVQRRALAMLRLSERRSASDSSLLARIAEYYFELNDWRRAEQIYHRITDRVGDHFGSARGLAEIALHEGKIAHVIHHFATARRIAETPALRRWARGETEYFSNLHSDDEYMEMEVSRLGLLDGLERSKRTALRIASLAFPPIVAGLIFEDYTVANIGWAVSTVAFAAWLGLLVASRMFSHRIPFRLLDDE